MMVICLWHMDLGVIKIWRALENSGKRTRRYHAVTYSLPRDPELADPMSAFLRALEK